MLLGPNDTIRNLHGHIHHYSVPIENDVNVGVDAPERELLKEKLPFGTPLSEQQIKEIYEARGNTIGREKTALYQVLNK